MELFFFHGILMGRYREVDAYLEGYEQFTRGFSTMRRKEDSSMSGVLAWVPEEEIDEVINCCPRDCITWEETGE